MLASSDTSKLPVIEWRRASYGFLDPGHPKNRVCRDIRRTLVLGLGDFKSTEVPITFNWLRHVALMLGSSFASLDP